MEKLETGLRLFPVAGLVLSNLEQVPVLYFNSDSAKTAADCVNLLRAGCGLVQIIDETFVDSYFDRLVKALELLRLPGEKLIFVESNDRSEQVRVYLVTREWSAAVKSSNPG